MIVILHRTLSCFLIAASRILLYVVVSHRPLLRKTYLALYFKFHSPVLLTGFSHPSIASFLSNCRTADQVSQPPRPPPFGRQMGKVFRSDARCGRTVTFSLDSARMGRFAPRPDGRLARHELPHIRHARRESLRFGDQRPLCC